jgi:hypothetical protein
MADPSVILAAQPPQIQSFQQAQNLANIGKLQQGELAAQPVQLQAAQLQNQQTQQNLDSTKALNDAWASSMTPGAPAGADGTPATPPGIDYDKMQNALIVGGHGALAPSIMKAHTEAQTAQTALLDQKAKLSTLQDDSNGAIGNVVKKAEYDPRVFIQQTSAGLTNNSIDPTLGVPALKQVQAALAQDPTGASAVPIVRSIVDAAIAKSPEQQKQIAAANEAQAKLTASQTGETKENAELPGQQATSAQQVRANAAAQLGATKTPDEYAAVLGQLPYSVAQQFAGLTPAQALARGLNPEQATTATQAAANATETQKRDLQTAANENANLGVARGRLAVEQSNAQVTRAAADPWGVLGLNKNAPGAASGAPVLHGDAFLATIPPQMAATVKAVAEGRQTDLPRGGKELDQLMGAVNTYDPTYSKQRAQLRSADTTGKQGQNIDNLNVAVVHLDQYHEVMKAMNNGTFQPGNQLYNWAAAKFGAANVTNPDFVRQSLAGEAASALKGNATDPEIAGVMNTLGKNQSPAQQEGTALEGLKILGAKLNRYDERYHELAQDDPWSPIGKTAQAVFDRYGITPLARTAGTPAPAAGGGTPARLAAPAAPAVTRGQVVKLKNGSSVVVTAVHPDGTFDAK